MLHLGNLNRSIKALLTHSHGADSMQCRCSAADSRTSTHCESVSSLPGQDCLLQLLLQHRMQAVPPLSCPADCAAENGAVGGRGLDHA